jgi:hypothetical protein
MTIADIMQELRADYISDIVMHTMQVGLLIYLVIRNK